MRARRKFSADSLSWLDQSHIAQPHPQQLHLDIRFSDADQAEQELLALGATRMHRQRETGFRVLTDRILYRVRPAQHSLNRDTHRPPRAQTRMTAMVIVASAPTCAPSGRGMRRSPRRAAGQERSAVCLGLLALPGLRLPAAGANGDRQCAVSPALERVQSHAAMTYARLFGRRRLEHVQEHQLSGAAMSIVVTYLIYLLVSAGLTVVVGQVLSRSGRLFLVDALGGSDSAARGISNLIVVCFYLISLGFVALTMRTSGDSVTAGQAIQLLATKIGEVLLLLAVLYLVGIASLTRLRRRLRAQAQPVTADRPEPTTTSASKAASPTGLSGPQSLWRPGPRRSAQ